MRRCTLVGRVAGLDAAMLEVDGRADDLLVEAPGGAQPGALYAARVDRQLAARAGDKRGAFLNAGDETLFLVDAAGLSPGDAVLVSVLRPAAHDQGKAATATRKLEFSGALATVTPTAPGVNLSRKIAPGAAADALRDAAAAASRGFGVVLRTRAAERGAEAVGQEVAALAARAAAALAAPLSPPRLLCAAPSLVERAAQLWGLAPKPAPAGRLAAVVRAALASTGPIAGADPSASLALTRTAAGVMVDVNTGAARDGQAVNLAAAAEIPRALRLRGWGGAVLIDFAGDTAGARPRLEAALARAGGAAWRPAGWGPLGFFEARHRLDRAPLETLTSLGAITEDDEQ